MNAPGSPPDPAPTRLDGDGTSRLIDRLFAAFESRHQTFTNRAAQFIAIPSLVWGGLAVLRSLPVPAAMEAVPGLDWAVAGAIVFSLAALALSLRLGAGVAAFLAFLFLLAILYQRSEPLPLWQPGLTALVLGWIVWLVGRRAEGRPRILSEIVMDLLMAPLWLIGAVLRLLRIGY